MHQLMRNIHLILGLVFVLVLSVYTLSSVRIARRTWFEISSTISEESYAVDPAQAGSPRELGLYLMQTYDFQGELFRVEPVKGDQFSFRIRRLGTNYQVSYTRGAEQADVKTNRTNFMGMLTSMHFATGLWHENWLINAWVVMLFLSSVGLFLLGASGVYLWFKTYEERVVGSILLSVGLVFALTLMVLVRTQA